MNDVPVTGVKEAQHGHLSSFSEKREVGLVKGPHRSVFMDTTVGKDIFVVCSRS